MDYMVFSEHRENTRGDASFRTGGGYRGVWVRGVASFRILVIFWIPFSNLNHLNPLSIFKCDTKFIVRIILIGRFLKKIEGFYFGLGFKQSYFWCFSSIF